MVNYVTEKEENQLPATNIYVETHSATLQSGNRGIAYLLDAFASHFHQ